LGLSPQVGTKRIAEMAHAAGIQTPISVNCSMILGGLTTGVSPLEMAHAYETFAEGGRRVYDPILGSPGEGPIGISEIYCPLMKCHGKRKLVATPHYRRVMPTAVADAVHSLLEGVTHGGTGTAAAIPGVDVVGKTGTTNNEGDAWFVGWTPQITTAVWVGFPNALKPMLTQAGGNPVTGGTFPAEIWKTFTEAAIQIAAEEHAPKSAHGTATIARTTFSAPSATSPVTTSTTPAPATTPSPTGTATTPAPTTPAAGATTPATGGGPTTPAPAPAPTTPAPAPTPTTPAGGGTTTPGGGSGGTGGAGLPGGG
ncbi:MAG TPA: penicillin-binding transpeptidase domain-containing protein, partial [Solirubrobacteraceae bacterium]|nr:penicillin-binding transpeptidase domain-containing protein [Solirubrobacteraceae bacterium]